MAAALHRRSELGSLLRPQSMVKLRQERCDGLTDQFAVTGRHELRGGLIGRFDKSTLVYGNDGGRARFNQYPYPFLSLETEVFVPDDLKHQ